MIRKNNTDKNINNNTYAIYTDNINNKNNNE